MDLCIWSNLFHSFSATLDHVKCSETHQGVKELPAAAAAAAPSPPSSSSSFLSLSLLLTHTHLLFVKATFKSGAQHW